MRQSTKAILCLIGFGLVVTRCAHAADPIQGKSVAYIVAPFSDGDAGASDPEVECSDSSIFDCARVYS